MDDPITSGLSGLADVSAPDPRAPSSPMNLTLPQPATPVSAPSGPHAGLMSMIQGMMLGMDAFGKSIATRGQQGGVQEVMQAQAAKQEMALKQAANARENTDFQTRQKLANANLLMATAQYHHNLQLYPLEERSAALKLNNEATAAYNEALSAGYDFQDPEQAAAWGRLQNRVIKVAFGANQDPNEVMAGMKSAAEKNGGSLVDYVPFVNYNDAKHGTGGDITMVPADGLQAVKATPRQIATGLADAKGTLMQATAAFGADNPDVQKFKSRIDAIDTALQGGNRVSAFDMQQLTRLSQGPMATMIGGKSKADAIRKEQQANDPLFKLENDPSQMAGEKASAAIPMLQNKMSDPATAPADKVRATRLLAVAQSAHTRFLQDQAAKENATQAAKQGDPIAAAQMVASGRTTIEELRTRGMTEKWLQAVINGAQKINPNYNPDDERNARDIAKNPAGNQFFGSANSLINKNGTLDQVVEGGAKLPNSKFPIFNKLADAQNYATGHPEVAAYMQTALGAADDYAKVLGGGTGTEGMQMHILNAMNASQNQDQRVAVVNAMRKAVVSQVESRIGNNPFLMRMYGGSLPQNQKPQGRAVRDGKGNILGYTTDGKTMTPAQ